MPKRSTNKQHLTAAVVCAIVVCLTETEFLQKTDLCKIDPKGLALEPTAKIVGKSGRQLPVEITGGVIPFDTAAGFYKQQFIWIFAICRIRRKATSFVTHFERAEFAGEASSRKYSASPSAFTMVLQRSGLTAEIRFITEDMHCTPLIPGFAKSHKRGLKHRRAQAIRPMAIGDKGIKWQRPLLQSDLLLLCERSPATSHSSLVHFHVYYPTCFVEVHQEYPMVSLQFLALRDQDLLSLVCKMAESLGFKIRLLSAQLHVLSLQFHILHRQIRRL